MLCLNSASLPLYVLQMKHISRNMARDTHNTRFYTLSSFCKSAISLKGLGKLGLLINEAPRQVSDLLEPAVPLSRALVSSLQSGDCEGGKEREPIQAWNCHQIFEKTVLEAPASLALKVCARNVVGEEGSLCQKARVRPKRPILSGGCGEAVLCPILGRPASSRFLELAVGAAGHPCLPSRGSPSGFQFLTHYFSECSFPHASHNRPHGRLYHTERLNTFQKRPPPPSGCVCG